MKYKYSTRKGEKEGEKEREKGVKQSKLPMRIRGIRPGQVVNEGHVNKFHVKVLQGYGEIILGWIEDGYIHVRYVEPAYRRSIFILISPVQDPGSSQQSIYPSLCLPCH
jgi:hypothetical protein